MMSRSEDGAAEIAAGDTLSEINDRRAIHDVLVRYCCGGWIDSTLISLRPPTIPMLLTSIGRLAIPVKQLA